MHDCKTNFVDFTQCVAVNNIKITGWTDSKRNVTLLFNMASVYFMSQTETYNVQSIIHFFHNYTGKQTVYLHSHWNRVAHLGKFF